MKSLTFFMGTSYLILLFAATKTVYESVRIGLRNSPVEDTRITQHFPMQFVSIHTRFPHDKNRTKKGHPTIKQDSLFHYLRNNKLKTYYNKALRLRRIRPRPSTSRTFTSISSPSFTISVTLATRSLASSEI